MKKTLVLTGLFSLSLWAQSLTLDDAIRIALENNRNLKISQAALQIADAQYHQALSARYPQLTATASAMRMDEDPSFLMKGSFALPQDIANGLALSGAVTQDEINALYSGGNTHTTLINTLNAAQAGTLPAQNIPLNMDVKQMDRDLGVLRVDMTYPLYTGGKVDALIRQAALNKSIQSEENRRSEAEIIYDVKRYYFGAMLVQRLSHETQITLDQMKVLKDLTESFYKGGSLKVKKTDYLRLSTTVSMIESMNEEMLSNVELARSALVNITGLPWNSTISLAETEFDTPKINQNLNTLIEEAYHFNPMINQLKLAVDVHSAKIDESSSAYLPSIALTANAQKLLNSYDAGVVDDTNRNSWTIGVGLKWNLFEGFRTDYAVQEAKLNKQNIQHKEVLLQEGLALQVKHAFLKMGQSQRQHNALNNAKTSSAENADLNTRAYQEDMVETKDVIEAQIMETFAKMAYYKNLHDFSLSRSQLEMIITSESSKVN